MKDRLLAVCAVLGALIYLFADAQIPTPVISDPLGPKVFPALIGIGLLGSGLLVYLDSIKKRAVASGESAGSGANPNKPRLLLLAMAVWTVAYYTAFEPVGYILSTVIYLFGLLLYFNPKRYLKNAIISALFTAAAYAVFAKFLGVSMPAGLLAF
jgi:putative tricarboxylic transport membrane protein